jgi:Flp pilus assembly protein TadD
METAALLLSGQEGGPLPVAVLAIPLEPQGERVRVAVVIEVDGSALIDEHAGGLLHLDLSAYAVGDNNSIAGSFANTLEVDPEQLGEHVERSGFQFFGELDLLPGTYSIRALIKNPDGASLGLRNLPIVVPDLKKAERFFLPPLFYQAEPDTWLSVQAVEIRNRPSAVQALGRDALPGARPILSLGKETEAVVPVFHLGDAADLRMEVRRTTASGQSELAADLPAKVTSRQPGSLPGLEMVNVAFTPYDLDPGGYTLRVKAAGETEGRPPGTAVILVNGEVGGRVWAEFTRSKRQQEMAAAGGGATAPVVPVRRRKKAVNAAEVETAYLAALRTLAGEDMRGARTAIAQLEEKILDKDNGDPDDLAKIELRVVEKLAQPDPSLLLPILVLHLDLYTDSWEAQNYLRSTHDREMYLRLVDLYAARNNTPEGRKLASRYFLSLANYLSVRTVQGIRRRVLEKALDLDRENLLILLCLAIDSEREGDATAAMRYLERAQKLAPDSGEVKTRMAINRLRLGNTREARRLLQEIANGPAPADAEAAWWHSLAYQELARLAMAEKRLDEAESTLRAGLQRWPRDEKLRVQLAALLDQRRRSQEAQTLLATLQTSNPDESSPRRRYTQLPYDDLDRDVLDVRQQSIQGMHALAAALKVTAPQGGAH